MAKQWSTIDFTEANSIDAYDSTKNSIYGGLENPTGIIRAPLNRDIPYLEQGHGAALPTAVYADSSYIYTAGVMGSGTTHRINRWSKTTLAWRGAIILTVPNATSEARITRDFWVNPASTEMLVGFTTTTTALGGILWIYGLIDADWTAESTMPVGINILAPRMCYWLRSGVIDRVVTVGTGTNTVSYSTVNGVAETRTLAQQAGGATWVAGTNVFTGGSITGWGVAYGGGIWVAVGETTVTVASSLDGMTWANVASGTALITTRGRGVCYGEIPGVGGRWVAVGVGGNSIIYSNDAITWLASANGNTMFSVGGYGVCWDGTKFIAVGEGTTHTMAYSADGITWTGMGKAGDGAAGHSPFTTNGNGIAYNGSQYVAVGTGGTSIAYSADGSTWTASAATKFSTTGNAICWGAPIGGTACWVAAGAAGAVNHSLMYSTNGNNWTGAGVTMFPTIANGVCWTGTEFVAVGTKGAGSFTSAYCGVFPPDTANWVGVLTNLPQTVAYGVASAPAPNMYPAKVGANYNVFSTITSICTSTPNAAVNNGTPNSFLLYILQSTNNPAALLTQQTPTISRLDLGTTMPKVQNGIITIPDTQRYSSGFLTGDLLSYLPSASISQMIYASPGANHGAGITGVPALFMTRGTTTARLGRLILSRFATGTSITKRARTSNIVTLTFAAHNFALGQRIYVESVGGSNYNSGNSGREPGTQILVTAATATTISYANTGANEAETPDVTGIVIPTIIGDDDYMADIPPLGATIQQVVQNFSGLSYDSYNDYFLIVNNGSFRDYRTVYAPGMPMERFFGVVNFETNPIAALTLPTAFSSMLSVRQGFGGRTLVVPRQGITAAAPAAQQLLLMEAGAQGGYVITKEIATTNATAFYRVLTSEVRGNSGSYGKERYDVYYRTSGISGNSGVWTKINDEATLTNVVAATSIQFKIVFDILNWTCISPEITSLTVTWEDGTTTDSHYQPSVGKSSVADKRFAWRFATGFGYSVPDLRVRLYDAVSGVQQCDDDTLNNPALGTFEQTTNDGGLWSAWTHTDKANDTTYLRYTPASTANNIRIKALLTLL